MTSITPRKKQINYPSFQSWVKKELKNPDFRVAYEHERALVKIAFALEEARLQRQFTQEDLAKNVGMKPEAISRLESGTHNMTVGTLIRVAGALGKQVEIR